MEENKALIRRWFEEVWNKRRASAIDEMYADGLAYGLHDDPKVALKGAADFKTFYETFCKAFGEIHVDVEDVIAEGDKIAARCHVTGVHTGDELGVPASHAAIDFTGLVFARIKDGKFVEVWNNFDFLSMNRQIGAL